MKIINNNIKITNAQIEIFHWCFLYLLLPYFSIAQTNSKDTILKNSQIEVWQSYKPQLKKTFKPEWIPQLPIGDTSHPVFNYIVPQQSLFYSYHSEPFRPLALGKDTTTLPFPNYLKAGVGNLYSLYLDASLARLYGKDYESFFHLHHISQQGSLKYEQSAISGLEAEGFYHKDNMEWHTNIDLERNQYYFYGYNHDLYNYNNSDSIRQTYLLLNAAVDFKRKETGDAKLDYHPLLSGYFYSSRFGNLEKNITFKIPFTYDIDTAYQALLTVSGHITHLKSDSTQLNNNLFEILLGLNVIKDKYFGHANLGFAIGKNAKFSILPDIQLNYKLMNTNCNFVGGWLSNINTNTFKLLSYENPYLFPNYTTQQTRTDEIFANIRGNYQFFTFNGGISYIHYNSLPTFVNNYGDSKQFIIVYDSLNSLSFHFGARYLFANKISLGLSGYFGGYFGGTQKYPWGIPANSLKADFSTQPLPQLTITSYLSLLGGIHALNYNGKEIALKPEYDFGCNGEYYFNKWHSSGFLQISNLFNQNFQRWLGYPSYGFNVIIGIRIKF